MKSNPKSGRNLLYFIMGTVVMFIISFGEIYAQQPSEGTMTFTVRTVTFNGNFSPRHVLAIWVEDADGWVLTRKLRAEKRKQYLYTWNDKSGGNVTDATTGATLSSHQSHTVTWNCKDEDGALVPDGEYRVYVEFTEEHKQGPIRMVAFTKGPDAVSLTPADDANFKDLELQFEPKIQITAGFTYTVDELAVNFVNTSTGASSFEWDFGDEQSSQEENPSHIYGEPGNYTVSLTATSGSNSDSDNQDVTLTSTVGIDLSPQDNLLIYPNPAKGIVSIQLDKDAGSSTIRIYTSNGSLLYSKAIEGKDLYRIDLRSYKSGAYIISVENQLHTYRQRIVKE